MNKPANHQRSFSPTAKAATRKGLVGIVPLAASLRAQGANDAVRIAIVGIGRKGPQHIQIFREVPGVRIVALCDADTEHLAAGEALFRSRNETVQTYVDYRKLLEDPGIDAVVIATPDHWHALMTIWACQAGKDVYVEKPASHNIREAQQMLKAARKYNRIVQVGSQNRSDTGLRKAIPWIREGNLGKILRVRGFHFASRDGIGTVNGPQPIPPSADYDLYLGPATMEPLRRQTFHYDWHWFWSTGTGEMGNIGAHHLDHARWAAGLEGLPERVVCFGGRYGWNDNGETPNTQIAYFDYQPFPILYEQRGLPRRKGEDIRDTYKGLRTSLRLECEGGIFAGGRGGGWAMDNEGRRIAQFPGDGGATHQANFIDAVRSRKVEDLRADIQVGHTSAILCHMANVSYLLGRRLPPESIIASVKENSLVVDAAERTLAHLESNEIDLNADPVCMGPMLTWDAGRGVFTGDMASDANMLLTRNYRAPYLIPDAV